MKVKFLIEHIQSGVHNEQLTKLFVCIHGDTYESNTSLVNGEAYETNKKVYLRE